MPPNRPGANPPGPPLLPLARLCLIPSIPRTSLCSYSVGQCPTPPSRSWGLGCQVGRDQPSETDHPGLVTAAPVLCQICARSVRPGEGQAKTALTLATGWVGRTRIFSSKNRLQLCTQLPPAHAEVLRGHGGGQRWDYLDPVGKHTCMSPPQVTSLKLTLDPLLWDSGLLMLLCTHFISEFLANLECLYYAMWVTKLSPALNSTSPSFS